MVANLTIYQKIVLRNKSKKVSSGKLKKRSIEKFKKSPQENELYKREVLRKSQSAIKKSPQEQVQKGVLRNKSKKVSSGKLNKKYEENSH